MDITQTCFGKVIIKFEDNKIFINGKEINQVQPIEIVITPHTVDLKDVLKDVLIISSCIYCIYLIVSKKLI